MNIVKMTSAIIIMTVTITLGGQNFASAKDNKTAGAELTDLASQMHEDLIEAATIGDLEEVRDLFESNELAPVLTDEHISDPIDYWKKVSVDGSARDIMAAIADVFSLPPVKNKDGDFIWPYLAQIPLKKLNAKQQIDLFRLVGPKQATQMLETGHYNYYEAKIGKDGTWHYFKKVETEKK